VPDTLADLAASAGGERRAAVCRELTKIHEEVVRGPLAELVRRAKADELTLRGEFVIVIEAVTAADAVAKQLRDQGPASMADARAEVARLVAGGAKRSDAVRQVASTTGLDRREIYRPD